MKILIVAATGGEIAPVIARLPLVENIHQRLVRYGDAARQIDVLVTGVGMVATAAWTSRELTRGQYDLALNFGVCGTFTDAYAPGSVVHVKSDRLVELGAEDGDAFLTIQQMGLLGENEPPFTAGQLVNASPPMSSALSGMATVDGVTVNTVHGDERSIARIRERFNPDVETMEGAAFMYVCLTHGIPFAQVRAVSNVVERRNRSAWKLDQAIQELGEAAVGIVMS